MDAFRGDFHGQALLDDEHDGRQQRPTNGMRPQKKRRYNAAFPNGSDSILIAGDDRDAIDMFASPASLPSPPTNMMIGTSNDGTTDPLDSGWTTTTTNYHNQITALGKPQSRDQCWGCSVEATESHIVTTVLGTSALSAFLSIVNNTPHIELFTRVHFIHKIFNQIIRGPINVKINLERSSLMTQLQTCTNQSKRNDIIAKINSLKEMVDWEPATICEHFRVHIATNESKLSATMQEMIDSLNYCVSNNLLEQHSTCKYKDGSPMIRPNTVQLSTIQRVVRTINDLTKAYTELNNNNSVQTIRAPIITGGPPVINLAGGGVLDYSGYNKIQFANEPDLVNHYLFKQKNSSHSSEVPQYIKHKSGKATLNLPANCVLSSTVIDVRNKNVAKPKFVNQV